MKNLLALLLLIALLGLSLFAWKANAQSAEQYRVILIQTMIGVPDKQLEAALNTAAREGWQITSVMLTKADNVLVVLRKP